MQSVPCSSVLWIVVAEWGCEGKMMDFCEGEIWTKELDVASMGGDGPWATIPEGAYAAAQRDGVVPWRVVYEKTKGGEGLRMTVDARPSMPRPEDSTPPHGMPEPLKVNIKHPDRVEECILSIDLGNTRTVALLVDHVLGPQDNVQVYTLPLKWDRFASKGGVLDEAFDSVLSLNVTDSSAVDFCGCEGRRSFVKLGRFAIDGVNRVGALQEKGLEGRYTLSSPKRYFWDRDPTSRNWFALKYKVSNGEARPSVAQLDSGLARAMAESSCKGLPHRLPPADMLSAMVVELYEQALHYVGSPEFKEKTRDGAPRRISKIHVTYPSTLNAREHAFYREQLSRGIAAYQRDLVSPPLVEVRSDIDEASAVLSVYAYSEIKKAGEAQFWLQTVGRRSSLGYEARVAVIDVGGGTTDLSISSIQALCDDAAVNPHKASIDLLHRDGANRAGDALVFDFLQRAVTACGLRALFGSTGAVDSQQKNFLENYAAQENEDAVRRLTREFWFDFALAIAGACDLVLQRDPDGKVDPQTLGRIEYELEPKVIETLNGLFGERLLQDGNRIQVSVTPDLVDAFKASIRQIFNPVAQAFAKAVSAFEVDTLLFSGKTADFVGVRNFFKSAMLLSEQSVGCMANYEVGNWCESLTGLGGRIRDSKVSTALGGALYVLGDYTAVGLSFSGLEGAGEEECEWGLVQGGENVAFAAPLFREGEMQLQQPIPLHSGRAFIARRTKYSRACTLSYELRVTPSALLRHGGTAPSDASVMLEQDRLHQALRISGCSGRFLDGTEVSVGDLECRIRSMSGEFAGDKIVPLQ